MTPVEACTQAVGYNHAVEVDDLIGSDKNHRLAYHRRLAAYVAHTHFGEHADTIAKHLRRQPSWAFRAFEQMAQEITGSRIISRDVEDTRRRAQAILDRHGVDLARERAAVVSPLSDADTAEARKLRARGWSITGLARRFKIDPGTMAPVIGETWGARQ